MFTRRYFWLKDHDRYFDPEGCYRVGTPVEGADPAMVATGVLGILTNRAWYGRSHPRIVSGELLPLSPAQ